MLSQARVRDVFLAQPGVSRLTARLTTAAFDASGIDSRRTVISTLGAAEVHSASVPAARGQDLVDAAGNIQPAGTGARNALYAEWAPRLANEAAQRALDATDFAPEQVTHVVTVTCTGFVSPGPDLAIVAALGLSPTTARIQVGFMGCCGAFPALRTADALCRADPNAVVLVVAVELCSLHIRVSDDPEQIVAMSLFADGCAAAVVSSRPAAATSLALESFLTSVLPDTLGEMGWTVGDQGFVMRLSARVPAHLGGAIRGALDPLLSERATPVEEWAVHPGGRAILERVEDSLQLSPQALQHSREVLREWGNMSSATVLFVLRRMLNAPAPRGQRVCAMAFGPGLTLEAATMRLDPAQGSADA